MMEFSVEESAAIKALGPLFNLTEVHLWDDGSGEVQEESYFREPTKLRFLMNPWGPKSIFASPIAWSGTSPLISYAWFREWSKHVVAIDIDPLKIEYARHNASLYGVDDKIDFISADSFSLAPKLKADTVFMSPPWGGPDYAKVNKFDINTMLKPHDGQHLFDIGRKIAPKIVMFLPKNVDLNQLAELSLSSSPPWSLQVEKNFLNERLIAVTAYFCEPSEI